jgi:hypothetical protein
VVVQICDSPTSHAAVHGQLDTVDELRSVRAYGLVLPYRLTALEHCERYALTLPPKSFQRSVPALAVAAHMDSFVPVDAVLNFFFPPARTSPPPPLGDDDASTWLVLASLFHVFRVPAAGQEPLMAKRCRRAMGATPAWHLVGFTASGGLPVTVHEAFGAAVLRRAAASRNGHLEPLLRVLALLRDALAVRVRVDDGAGTRGAWHAAIQRRETTRFSNVLGAVYCAHGAKGTADLLNHARRQLLVSPHADTRALGAHLLVTAARVWRAAARDALATGGVGKAAAHDDAHRYLQQALQYSVLAVEHWGKESACSVEVAGGPWGTPSAGRVAAERAFGTRGADAAVAAHYLATVLGESGVQLGWLRLGPGHSPVEPQMCVERSLNMLKSLRDAAVIM